MKIVACKVKEDTFNDIVEICENSDCTKSEWIRGLIENEFHELEEERKAYEENKELPKGTLTRVDNSDKPPQKIFI